MKSCAYPPCLNAPRGKSAYCSDSCRAKASYDRRFVPVAQMELPIAKPVDVLTVCQRIRSMLSNQWMAVHEARDRYRALYGVYFSESGMSARIRDCRKAKYGGYTVSRRPVPEKAYFEYSISA